MLPVVDPASPPAIPDDVTAYPPLVYGLNFLQATITLPSGGSIAFTTPVVFAEVAATRFFEVDGSTYMDSGELVKFPVEVLFAALDEMEDDEEEETEV